MFDPKKPYCPHCGNRLDGMLAVDDCPENFHNHDEVRVDNQA